VLVDTGLSAVLDWGEVRRGREGGKRAVRRDGEGRRGPEEDGGEGVREDETE
jgi:hypothetical protein